MRHFLGGVLAVLCLQTACSGESTDFGPGGAGSGAGGSGGAEAGTGGSSAGRGGTGGGGSDAIPIAQAPIELANAACAKLFECCSAEELMGFSVVGESVDQCRLTLASLLGVLAADLQDSVDAGRAAYDSAALAGCLADVENRSCDMLPGIAELGCAGALTPLVELGGACGTSTECIDGYCEGGGSAASASGECVPLLGDGETCSVPAQCESGNCDTNAGCTEPGPTLPLCGG